MLLAVGILVAFTIAVAAGAVVPRVMPRQLKLDADPDTPCPFGSDMSWLAVKTGNADAVVDALGLSDVRPANWNSGVGAVYDSGMADSHVFVAPPIQGWTLVASLALPLPAGSSFVDKTTPFLERLAGTFASVHYFATFPGIDFYSWARFDRGRPIRFFAMGEAGVVVSRGRLTAEERRLGLSLTELRGIRGRQGDLGGEILLHPTEPHVLSLAAAWSINPMAIDGRNAVSGVGRIGLAPQSWRPRRQQRAA